MPDNSLPPIIIRKKHPEDDSRHAGAWKIALADMMTAMMAFFLVLWLISATDPDTLSGIADHFKPQELVVTQMISGSDSIFGGQSILDPEGLPLPTSSVSILTGKNTDDRSSATTDEATVTAKADSNPSINEDEISNYYQAIDERNFRELEKEISNVISSDPELSPSMHQIQFIREKEGLRIQIVDEEDSSMFGLGTSDLLPRATNLIGKVAHVISNIPNRIIIRGHTDSHAYRGGAIRNNWVLSAERAETTRQYLQEAGVDVKRFAKIEGVADTDAYVPEDLFDPRNRRINIILKYQGG